jgi:hypothetical protein
MGLLSSGDDGLLSESRRADAQSTTRPNIVLVMTDDLDEQSMQRLPGIREVMSTRGITFENAYVTTLCAVLLGPPFCGVSTPTTTA